MKYRLLWAGALALAVTLTSQIQSQAAYTNANGTVITNGVIFVTTRSAGDAWWRNFSSSTVYDGDDPRGPGAYSPGDVKMCELLQDHGYSTRLIQEKALSYLKLGASTAGDQGPTYFWDYYAGCTLHQPGDSTPDPVPPSGTTTEPYGYYYNGGLYLGNGLSGGGTPPHELYSAMLIIVSGSGSSADMPIANSNGVPIICGEHSCLGTNRANAKNERSELYLYANKDSGNITATNAANRYVKVTAVGKTHPIMQGIPLDAQDRVKLYRDPYPEESAYTPWNCDVTNGTTRIGKLNYELATTYVNCAAGKSIPAPGLQILAVMDSNTNQVVFAVMERGGTLAAEVTDSGHPWYGRTTAPSRLVQLFVNEGGNGNSRRGFNCLSDIAKVIFIRTCKWAMEEELQPYQPLGLIQVSKLTGSQIQLAWTGTATKNYKILGSADLLAGPRSWQTVVEDIKGLDGTVTAKLDIAGGPQYAFLQVVPVP